MNKNCNSTILVNADMSQGIIDRCFNGRNRQNVVPAILQIIKDLEKYHPLTVRQVYYQLVAREVIDNHLREYRNTSRILTRLREEGLVPWSVITDRSRRLVDKRGISNVESHIQENMTYLFDSYNRCLVQNQCNYAEVWIEKDALSSIFEDVVWKYCCRIVVCRGHLSATFYSEYADRAESAIMRGQRPVILYFGDLDPTGARCPHIIERKLKERHSIEANVQHVSLLPGQVEEYRLPHNPEATKKTDPNYAWYRDQGFSDYSVELDALHPEILTNFIDNALQGCLDVDDMLQQQEIQKRERLMLKTLRLGFIDLCHKQGISI